MTAMAERGSVLVFGGTGMLGHELVATLSTTRDVHFTARGSALAVAVGLPGTSHDFEARVGDPSVLIDRLKPDAVVNAIGIVKQLPEASVPTISIAVNSLFPHRLNEACSAAGVRLIHISTDCVFSGALPIGQLYSEDHRPDADDLYGRSKLLGEVVDGSALTLRTSIIGWELERVTGLLEWFAEQRGRTVQGFTRAIFTGVTTRALGGVVSSLLDDFPDLRGLFHVASTPITKFDLLTLLRDVLGQDTTIEPRTEPVVNRGLDGARFEQATGIAVPDWEEMSAEYASGRSKRRKAARA